MAPSNLKRFKLPPNRKFPPPARFYEIATADVDKVCAMWSEAITGDTLPDNVGILTGGGIIVLDVDVRAGRRGRESLRHLIEHDEIPMDSYCVRTPSGGLHVYLPTPPDIEIRNQVDWMPGIDVRGWHGYVCGCGSVVDGVEYVETTIREYGETYLGLRDHYFSKIQNIVTAPIGLLSRLHRETELKDWNAGRNGGVPLIELDQPENIATAERLIDQMQEVEEGRRNARVFAVAKRLGDLGISPGRGFELCLAFNEAKCRPPLGAEEVERTCDSAFRGKRNIPLGACCAEAEFDAQMDEEPRQNGIGLFNIIDIRAWEGQPIPERDWVSLNRIPAGNVTLFSGEGGIGKTIVALDSGVSSALELSSWLGAPLNGGTVLAFLCEDDEQELHRRIAALVEYYMVNYSDLVYKLNLISMAGEEDPFMALPDKNDIMRPTKLFQRFREQANDIHARFIIIDNSADVFGGNESDRRQVRQFVGMLRRLASETGAGVLLNSHPSLTGISSGTGLSGSTHWHNSVRSRMYLRAPNSGADEAGLDPKFRVLEIKKNNYGPSSEKLILRWSNGMFVPVGAGQTTETETDVDTLFMRLLDEFTGQGRNVAPARTANNYAPTLFAQDPSAKGVTKLGLERSMARLFALERIRVETYGPPSKRKERIERNA